MAQLNLLADELSMESTLCHEFGHTLGLDHSHDRNAVMFPIVDNQHGDTRLAEDDIRGIISLYGPHKGATGNLRKLLQGRKECDERSRHARLACLNRREKTSQKDKSQRLSNRRSNPRRNISRNNPRNNRQNNRRSNRRNNRRSNRRRH